MSYKILLSLKANSFLKKLNNADRIKIENRIRVLSVNPELGKPLVGKLYGLWSLRIGDYRAIYKIQESELIVFVVRVGHRKNVYDF